MPSKPSPSPRDAAQPARRRRRALLIAGVAAGVLIGAGVILYVERGPIGAGLARSYLEGRGVPAQIFIERLDTRGFTGRMVLGDPRDPDLVVDRVEMEFEAAPLFRHGLAAPRIRSIRLVHPQLKARFDGRRLTFGTLQGLVDDFARRPPGTAPGPDVVVERGLARVATTAGPLVLTGDARLDKGRLTRLAARLAPTTLSRADFSARLTGAAVEAHSDADELFATIVADAPEAARGGVAGRMVHASLQATLGYDSRVRFDGPVRLTGTVTAAEFAADRRRLTAPRLDVALQGRLQQPVGRLGFTGSGAALLTADRVVRPDGEFQRLRLDARGSAIRLIQTETGGEFGLDAQLSGAAASARIGGFSGRDARLSADVSRVNATWNKISGFATARPAATLNLAGLSGAGSSGRGVDLVLSPADLEVSWGDAGWSIQTGLQLHGRADRFAAPALGGSASLRAATLELRGPVNLSGRGLSADLTAGLRGQGGLDPAAAAAVASAVPVIGQDASGRQALEKAVRSGRLSAPNFEVDVAPGKVALHLGRPIEFAAASGGRASLAATRGGGLAFRANDGGLPELAVDAASYRLGVDGEGLTFEAPARLRLAFSGSTWRDLQVEAEGTATRQAGVISLDLTECAPVSAAAFGEGPQPLVTTLKLRACPDASAPLVRLGPEQWRMRTRLRDLAFEAPAGQVALRDGDATAELEGAGGEPAGVVTLASARLQDVAPTPRFEPLRLDGRLDLARGVWTGPLRVADGAQGRTVAQVRVRHVMDGATGHADIAAPDLAFAPDGLQPSDLTPVGADMVRAASGVVSFTGQADWRPGTVTSNGRMTTTGFDFRSPAGPVKGARADLTFLSLAPLVSAPGQAISADSIAAVVPLEAPTASVEVKADRIVVERAGAGAARGRVTLDPMELPFAPGSAVSGVLRLDEVDLDALIDQFNLAEKVTLQAKVDGAIPFSWSDAGLRFSMGKVFATGPGRLTISRDALTSAVATGPAAAPGFQDIAYQALEDLAFDRLEAEVNSRPMGRLGVVFRINGRHDPPREGRTRIGLFDLLRGQAFAKPIDLPKGTPVNLTLDTSLNFDELLAAYSGQARSEPVQSGGPKS